jgi:hypothetical protein
LTKYSSGSNKKGPTASIIPINANIATHIDYTVRIKSPEPMEGRDEPPVHKTYTRPHTFKDIFLDVVEKGQNSMWMYFMKFLSASDVLTILTSNKGLFSSKVLYQLVMYLSRWAFPKHAHTVIVRMLKAVENESLRTSPIRLLRLMDQQSCELCMNKNHGVLNYASFFGCAFCSYCLRENLVEVPVAEIYRRSSRFVQFHTFSKSLFRPHVYRINSCKVTYHLKKGVGEKYGETIQVSSICSSNP